MLIYSILVIVCFIFNFLTNNCIHNDQVANSSGGRTIVGPIGGLAPSTFLSTNKYLLIHREYFFELIKQN